MAELKKIQITELLSGAAMLKRPDREIYERIRRNWDSIAKPLDGMGCFESIIARIGAIQGTTDPQLHRRGILIMIADNGIVEEGVSQSGQEVTLAVAYSMGRQGSSVGRMAYSCQTDAIPVDIGINSAECPIGVQNRKVRRGSRNFAKEPALTREELLQAIQVGMDMVYEGCMFGYRILGAGEMGIGNTTTTAAVAASLLGLPAEEVTGRGAGLDKESLARKIRIIQEAIDRYGLYGKDPLTVLETVGGLDIAGLVGVMIGGACYDMPIVLDGVITVAAAYAAACLFPEVKDYLIPSHASRETASARMLEKLELEPVIDANMALGEGTGAVMLMPLLELVMTVYNGRTTFSDIAVEAYSRFED